jgi:hypothetical protein
MSWNALARLLRETPPDPERDSGGGLARLWERLTTPQEQPQQNLSPIVRNDLPGFPYVANPIALDPLEAARFGAMPESNLDALGVNTARYIDRVMHPNDVRGTGAFEEIELAGMNALQARDLPNVRQRDDGTWVMDREITERFERPPFEWDDDATYMDLAAEHGFEGPRQFFAALTYAMLEPGPGDLFQVLALPWSRLARRVTPKVGEFLDQSLQTARAVGAKPASPEAADGFITDALTLSGRADLFATHLPGDARGDATGPTRAVWRVQPDMGNNYDIVIETPAWQASQGRDGLQLHASLKELRDYRGRPSHAIYVHTMTNYGEAGREIDIVGPLMDLADVWGLPMYTYPLSFMPTSASPGAISNGRLSTAELRAMYNRMGFEPYTASRKDYPSTVMPLHMWRDPLPPGAEPAADALRQQLGDARLQDPILQAGRNANKARVQAEKAQQTLAPLNAPGSNAVPDDFFLRHPDPTSASWAVDPVVEPPMNVRGTANPRRLLHHAIHVENADPFVAPLYDEFLTMTRNSNEDLAHILMTNDPRSFGMTFFDPDASVDFLMNDVFGNEVTRMQTELNAPLRLIQEMFAALVEGWR